MKSHSCFKIYTFFFKEKRCLSLGEEEMERAPGDGHSLAKMTVVESSGQIETCR